MKLTGHLIFSALACLLMGCYSTPQTRIDRNPDLYATFSEEDKALILEGKVEVGFTQKMVHMAAGPPHQITKKKNQTGIDEVWIYYKYWDIGPANPTFNSDGSQYWHDEFFEPSFLVHISNKELVVDFENGAVIAFE